MRFIIFSKKSTKVINFSCSTFSPSGNECDNRCSSVSCDG